MAARPQSAFAAAFAVLTLALAGCASGLGANSYERGTIGAVARVDEDTVVASRPIIIEGSNTGTTVGTATGAAIGGIVDLLHEGGLAKMHEFISDTAAWGDMISGPRIVDQNSRDAMKAVLDEIQDATVKRLLFGG